MNCREAHGSMPRGKTRSKLEWSLKIRRPKLWKPLASQEPCCREVDRGPQELSNTTKLPLHPTVFVEKKNYIARNILSVSNANEFFNDWYKILMRWLIHTLTEYPKQLISEQKRHRKIGQTCLRVLFCSANTLHIGRSFKFCTKISILKNLQALGYRLQVTGQNAFGVSYLYYKVQ